MSPWTSVHQCVNPTRVPRESRRSLRRSRGPQIRRLGVRVSSAHTVLRQILLPPRMRQTALGADARVNYPGRRVTVHVGQNVARCDASGTQMARAKRRAAESARFRASQRSGQELGFLESPSSDGPDRPLEPRSCRDCRFEALRSVHRSENGRSAVTEGVRAPAVRAG